MHVHISKPIPKARIPKAGLVRNPIPIKVKGIIVAMLNQNPSAIRPIHLTPHPNVALAFGKWGDIRFVDIVKTCRASSMREKSHAAFSWVKIETWWNKLNWFWEGKLEDKWRKFRSGRRFTKSFSLYGYKLWLLIVVNTIVMNYYLLASCGSRLDNCILPAKLCPA